MYSRQTERIGLPLKFAKNWRDAAAYLLSVMILVTVSVERGPFGPWGWRRIVTCACFAVIAYLLKDVTVSGAVAGFAVSATIWIQLGNEFFVALVAAFAVTWLSTRLGRSRKERQGIAELRRGRDGLQVLANVGLASVAAILSNRWGTSSAEYVAWPVLAVLAESAADTSSSEIGKAFGGTPRMITSRKPASPGTNGAVSVVGSLAGILAAGVVCLSPTSPWSDVLAYLPAAIITVVAATAGMFFDSLLGATLEDRWLNNDAVNFLSTCFAALVAIGLLLFRAAHQIGAG